MNTDIRRRFQKNPEQLREMLQNKPAGTLVIIDEIPKVPKLLDEVHWLMTNKDIRFILCGSSARKIIVSLDKMTREANGIEMIYVLDFFKMLWSGQII